MSAALLLLFLSHLVLIAATENKISLVETNCSQDVVLKCTAKAKPGLQYMAVRWYTKTEKSLRGLVSRMLPNGQMRWYLGVSKDISLVNDSLDLQVSNVSCSDAGVYQCYLAADVGEQNREGLVQLSVTDCPTVVPPTPEKSNNGYMIFLLRYAVEQFPVRCIIVCGSLVVMAILLVPVVFGLCFCNVIKDSASSRSTVS